MKIRTTKIHSAYALVLLAAAFLVPAAWPAPARTTPAAAPPVVVALTVEKQISAAVKDGQPAWQPLSPGKATVLPGDVLRYIVTGSNRLSRPIQGFVLTQPIPRGTEYLPQSAATVSGDARMTVSLDGGKTYAEKPTVKVTHPDGTTTDEPAPVTLYTHIRWTFIGDLPALGSVSAHCAVRVR